MSDFHEPRKNFARVDSANVDTRKMSKTTNRNKRERKERAEKRRGEG